MKEHLLSKIDEINYIAELIPLYKDDGLNRLKIWKVFVEAGYNKLVILEAFRKAGLFSG